MPQDEIDSLLITNEFQKHKLASYVTNKDNISADKDETVKRMKHTADPCEWHNILMIFDSPTNNSLTKSQSHIAKNPLSKKLRM